MSKQATSPYRCQVCKFLATSAAHLNQHMDSAHFDIKPTQYATAVRSKPGQSSKLNSQKAKWFECSVCHQRYGHPDGLRYHQLKSQHSKVSTKIEEEQSDDTSSSSSLATDSQATYKVYIENSSIEALNETIDTDGLKQISLPRNNFGECQECNLKLAARQNRCSHCDGLFCSKCRTCHVASMKAELEKSLGHFDKGLPKLNKKIDETFEKRKSVLDQAFNRVKNDIRSSFKRLIDELKAREERLLKTAEVSMAAQMKAIELEKQALKKSVNTIENYVQLSKKNQFKKDLGAGQQDRRIEAMTNKLKAFEKSLGELDHKRTAQMRFQTVNRKELSLGIKTFGSICSPPPECSAILGDSSSSSMVSLSFSSACESYAMAQARTGLPSVKALPHNADASPDGTSWRRKSSSNTHELVACLRDLDLASRE